MVCPYTFSLSQVWMNLDQKKDETVKSLQIYRQTTCEKRSLLKLSDQMS